MFVLLADEVMSKLVEFRARYLGPGLLKIDYFSLKSRRNLTSTCQTSNSQR